MGAVAKNANDKKMRLTIDRSTNRQRDTNTVLAFSECEYFPPCQTRNVNCFLSLFFAPEKREIVRISLLTALLVCGPQKQANNRKQYHHLKEDIQ